MTSHEACRSITDAQIQALIDRIGRIPSEADATVAANEGKETVQDPARTYAGQLRDCQDRMTTMLRYLRDEVKAFGPSGKGPVTNHVAGYEIYNRVLETVHDLHRARDRAAVSAAAAAQLDPRGDASGVLGCIRSVTEALPALETMSAQATRCYLSPYYPDV